MPVPPPGYRVVETLYESPRTIVHRARREADDQLVILKQLKITHPSPHDLVRFRTEYEIAHKLQGPHLVHVDEMIKHMHRLVLVEEDFGGRPLLEFIPEDGMSIDEFLDTAIKTTRALGDLHSQGVIHRDLTPKNVLLNPATGELKLVDFGLSTPLFLGEVDKRHAHETEGTLPYMSPEQTGRTNRQIDYRTDFYSLGTVFYQMATGALPFEGADDPAEWFHCHLARDPIAVRQRRAEIAPVLSDIIMRLMAKAPEERYQSAHGLLIDLERCQEQWRSQGSIEAFELGERDVRAILHVSQKLYGRDDEVRRLMESFEQVSRGSRKLVLVSGPTGIGKTALTAKLQQSINAKSCWFGCGKFGAGQQPMPYGAVSEALRSLISQLFGFSSTTLAKWRKRIGQALGDDAALLSTLIPELTTLLGPLEGSDELQPTEARHRFGRALLRFVSVFCQPERPLILQLSDLQRADEASLALLETLVSAPELESLLVVGTYRDDEVDADHALRRTIEALEHAGQEVEHIALPPLSCEQVKQLVADTLRPPEKRLDDLAALVHAKTSGNPYFINRFLENLNRESLLWFDPEDGRWCWNQERIEEADITENVIDLLLVRLEELPEQTRTTLTFAALMGSTFELELLARVRGASLPEVYRQLEPALNEGILKPSTGAKLYDPKEVDSPVIIEEFSFTHDRLQEAAAQLATRGEHHEAQLLETHKELGRTLQSKLHEDSKPQLIFETVGHLNLASELLEDPFEALEVERLNLRAGHLALESMAFVAARGYLRQADELMDRCRFDGKSKWETQFELAWKVALARSQAEALAGNLEAAETICIDTLDKVEDPVRRATLCAILVRIRALAGRLGQAVQAAREGLAPLGIELPREGLDELLDAKLDEVDTAMAQLELDDLPNLPRVDDPRADAALKLLVAVEPAAGLLDFRLVQIVGLESTKLTLAHGMRTESLSGLSHYGVTLSLRGRAQEGYRVGQLALHAARESQNDSVFCHVAFINAAMLMHWSRPLRDCVELLAEGHEAGMRAGNVPFAGWCKSCELMYSAMAGEELHEVFEHAEAARKLGNKYAHGPMTAQAEAYVALARNLLGHTTDEKSFASYEFADADALLEHCRSYGLDAVCATFQVARAQVAYIYGDAELTVQLLEEMEENIGAMVGTFDTGRWSFYMALGLADRCHQLDAGARKPLRRRLDSLQDSLSKLGEQCPPNYLHKRMLVDAEVAWLDDRFRDAISLFDRAIEEATMQGFTHLEALANERAGEFWLAYDKPDFAASYLWRAERVYRAWGANRKVAALRSEYRDLIERGRTTGARNPSKHQAPIDLTSVFKAVESIAAKLDLNELLSTLMRVVLENAGAQHGTFFAVEGHSIHAVVEGRINSEPTQPATRLELDEWVGGARSVVRYVQRTDELVVLGRASSDPRFADDPYLDSHAVRSILCMPVEESGEVIGILYVENNLHDYAFTKENTRVLKILAGHIAVSLNKAKLYDELKEKEERFRQLAENIEEVFWLMDWPSREIVYVSPAYEKIWNRRVPSDPVPLGDWLEPVVERHRHVVATCLAEKAPQGGYDVSYQIERPSGELRWVHDRGFPIRDRHGKTYRIAGVAVDITRQHEIKKMKDEFISIVSHELRTPLTPITGIFRLLAENSDEELSERSRQMVDLGLRNARRLLRIIDDLLDMQKLSLEKVDFDEEILDLYEVVSEAVEINAALGEPRGVRVELDAPDEPLCVQADRGRLLQVFTNLLSNAIKFTDEGTSVDVAVRRINQRGQVSVRDHGPGIPPEARANIFEKFTQADSSMTRKHGGTGLGLTIAKSIVGRLDGRINFDSEVGEGTTFYVEFPLVEGA
ncbi:GAF domain-containing protein [Persicimonas caeni]|uniref:histidine kinase n=1 Tax=Persicimonas caeni TaxID=2292766 RepID=A0A4Y6PQP5_PERCE|nr:AAA family ATPase [Persicimonas caeni]QDG50644.1 GAF domain-containing protein [Persicimonas caeni]QED31865.1 AAA family ATPase [Persicimonas caeni]